MSTITRDIPKVVYHYTSIEAMMGIVDSRNLWCSSIAYLNDAKEREYLLEAARRRLPILKSQDSSIPKEFAVDAMPMGDNHDLTSFADEPFVTSFAEESDSLMHWRSYCPQQSGVAIGFQTACLDNARLDETAQAGMLVPPSGFGKVKYIDAGNDEKVDSEVRKAIITAKLSAKVNGDESPLAVAELFQATIDIRACISKHSSFEVEGEYRLVVMNLKYRENNLKFRTVRSTLVPYVEMHIPNQEVKKYDLNSGAATPWDAVQSVVIGPTANMDLTKRSLEAFFALRGMNVEVKGSVIPYRDW